MAKMVAQIPYTDEYGDKACLEIQHSEKTENAPEIFSIVRSYPGIEADEDYLNLTWEEMKMVQQLLNAIIPK